MKISHQEKKDKNIPNKNQRLNVYSVKEKNTKEAPP